MKAGDRVALRLGVNRHGYFRRYTVSGIRPSSYAEYLVADIVGDDGWSRSYYVQDLILSDLVHTEVLP